MNHPDFGADLHGIHNAEGLASMPQRQLQDAGAKPVQRLGDRGMATFGDNAQCIEQFIWATLGNSSKSFLAPLIQAISLVFRTI
jgi:hypothetical protein